MQLDLSTLDWSAVSALSTIAIAGLGFAINSHIRKIGERSERYSLLVSFRKEIIAFSAEFFDLTAAAITECDCAAKDAVDIRKCSEIAASLSALADKGRFIFPNYRDGTGWGNDKGPAFEGFRREPLDAILASYFGLLGLKSKSDRDEFLRLARRELIKAGQPLSTEFDPKDPKSVIVEARRAFLNAVVPSTFPRKWRKDLSELLGPMEPVSDAEVDSLIQQKGW